MKPLDFIPRSARGLVQPAVKYRGRENLRIIYGSDYDAPRNLDRLRSRGLGRKRALALGEFALGVEALELSWFSVNWKNVAGELDTGIRLRVSHVYCTDS